jgi:hypothetical protein
LLRRYFELKRRDALDRKKELQKEYKERKITGGVFRVVNNTNGKYLLDCTPDLQARQNAFNFMVTQSSCFDYKLAGEWEAHGPGAFFFEVLDTLVKKDTQSPEEFQADLKTLAGMWSEKLDAAKRY